MAHAVKVFACDEWGDVFDAGGEEAAGVVGEAETCGGARQWEEEGHCGGGDEDVSKRGERGGLGLF